MNRLTSQPETPLNSFNLAFIEELYVSYLRDPSSVPPDWRRYFEQFSQDDSIDETRLGPSFRPTSFFNPAGRADGVRPGDAQLAKLQNRVDQLIRNYRVRGHMIAARSLGIARPHQPELDPEFYGFTDADMDRAFRSDRSIARTRSPCARSSSACGIPTAAPSACSSCTSTTSSCGDWLQERMEGTENRLQAHPRRAAPHPDPPDRRGDLRGVHPQEIHRRQELLAGRRREPDSAARPGDREGRPNRASTRSCWRWPIAAGSTCWPTSSARARTRSSASSRTSTPNSIVGRGDVKYHLGYSNDWRTAPGQKVHLSLCFNPSHLEFVNPVAVGRMRAKQDRVGDRERERGMALLIHGDAAFRRRGRGPGDAQPEPACRLYTSAARSTSSSTTRSASPRRLPKTAPAPYATDVAKMLQIPIFHVNGEDPEAVAQVVQLSHGFPPHASSATSSSTCTATAGSATTKATSPRSRSRCSTARSPSASRCAKATWSTCSTLGEVTREEADEIARRRREHLEKELSEARSEEYVPRPQTLTWRMGKATTAALKAPRQTSRPAWLKSASRRCSQVQTAPSRRLPSASEDRTRDSHRREMADGKRPLDWSAAEALAFASLATEGVRVRLTGQDTARGTFSQRHAVLHDFEDGHLYMPLQHLSTDQAPVEIYNSPLSELACSASSTATAWTAPTGWFCGRPSSATSSTPPR